MEDVRAYGIDWDEPVNLTHIESLLSVPDITNPLGDQILRWLDPLKESYTFGVDIYVEALTIIRDLVVY